MDQAARVAAADGAAGRALALQHRRLGARRAVSTRGGSVVVRRGAAAPPPRAARHDADTSFVASDAARLATAYANTPDGLTVWDPPDGKWSRPPAFEDGAAGLVSTADDLLAFARMFLRDGAPVLSRESVTEMTRDQLTRHSERDRRRFSANAVVGALPVGRHLRRPGGRVRVGRRARDVVPRRPAARPRRHRADPASVGRPAAAGGAHRPAGRRLCGAALTAGQDDATAGK